MKPGNPFATPEGYFEGFEARLKERMETRLQPVRQPAQRTILRQLVPYAAAASFILIALAGGRFLVQQLKGPGTGTLHAEISIAVEENLHAYSEAVLLEAMEESPDLPSAAGDPEEEMINYLLDSDISDAELLNAL